MTQRQRLENFLKMNFFNVTLEDNLLTIGFGSDQTSNDNIVRQAREKISGIKSQFEGLEVLKVNGPASLPVAMMLAHEVSHIVQSVACYDPKLGKYVVAVSHSPLYTVGDLVD